MTSVIAALSFGGNWEIHDKSSIKTSFPNFLKIINGATGKNNTTEVKLDKFVVSEKFNSGFALDLMVKDVSIANSLIKDLTTKNPLSKSVSHYLSETLEELGGNPDHTEVYKVLLKN